MAGDWIKLETSTPDKPETHRVADLLGVNADEAVGILVRFWMWLDRNSCNGHVTHVYAKPLESMMRCPGFVAAMADVGWLDLDEKTGLVTIPNFDRHNGKPAKSRALTAARVKRLRNADVTQPLRNGNGEALPEKRRDITPIVPTPSGFDAWWMTYPKKRAKTAAISAWRKLNPDAALQGRLVAALQAQCQSEDWRKDGGKFVPHPASWLNGRRWEDELIAKPYRYDPADPRDASGKKIVAL